MGKQQISKKSEAASFYQVVWRWHFYAGVIFAPFLFILAFSGGVYLFKPQIEAYLYQDMLIAETTEGTPLSYSSQVEYVLETYPDATISSVVIDDDPRRTTEFVIREGEVSSSVFVNPYTGDIQGKLDNEAKLSEVFKKIHSELLIAGTIGNRIVELAACWAVILLVTGLYIWWPRNRRSIWGMILPRFSKKGRVFWRDLHAVPAFWLSAFILVLIATGLPWSGVLGPQIQNVATTPQYAYSFGEKPESITLTKDVVDEVPWANENVAVPSSQQSNYIPLTIDETVSIFNEHSLALPYTVSMPMGEHGVYTASHMQQPADLATLHMDQYSGAVLSDVRFANFSTSAKLVEAGIALHEGRLFGWPNQLLGLLTCLGLMGIVVTSFIMWKKRKPAGKIGAPPKSKNKKATRIVFFIMIGFGLLMPLVGGSLLVILVFDQLIRPFILKKRDSIEERKA
ncbi:PepSY-associated TM helix domain-containing protein [Shouchella clausii]|uniref:PepSY-associated TM helix domain-containing protein n=1 Tax=Shouchella clausii TaxID=79880 RepID=UPI00079716C8|nr:PepSY domain-containing protein [Shouchella clausii]KKI86313.1 iron-regulated membrane protein [Shouchella clausii]